MAYSQMWEIEVRHDGLKKYRHIRGSDRYVVEQKALAQRLAWDEMWAKRVSVEEAKNSKLEFYRTKFNKAETAITKTKEAEESIKSFEGILNYTLKINDAIQWESLFDNKPYPVEKPRKPTEIAISEPPNQSSSKYEPRFSFSDKFFSKSKNEKERMAKELYHKDYSLWLELKKSAEINKKIEISGWMESVVVWENGKEVYEQEQKLNNEKILERKKTYLKMDSDAIVDYCDMVLAKSQYPDSLSPDWNFSYQSDTKIIVVGYLLPSIDDLPRTKTIKYVASRDEFVESIISAAETNKLYDSVIYQITLRTIHELFEADVVNALSSIVFNGWVNFVEKSTGRDSNACIISVQAEKDEFMAINLERVEPKACFTLLKGVGSSKLHG